jgi:hypothetical protein
VRTLLPRLSGSQTPVLAEELPEDLVFHVNYLGGDMPDFRNAIAHFDRHPVTVPLTHEESAGFNHM